MGGSAASMCVTTNRTSSVAGMTRSYVRTNQKHVYYTPAYPAQEAQCFKRRWTKSPHHVWGKLVAPQHVANVANHAYWAVHGLVTTYNERHSPYSAEYPVRFWTKHTSRDDSLSCTMNKSRLAVLSSLFKSDSASRHTINQHHAARAPRTRTIF